MAVRSGGAARMSPIIGSFWLLSWAKSHGKWRNITLCVECSLSVRYCFERGRRFYMAVNGAEDSILILKHVGGLTSGQTMSLRRGVYQFGPSKTEDAGLDVGDPAVVSFELEVRSVDEVILSPGRDAVSIEGRTVSQPVPLAMGHTIQAGPDLFVLGRADDQSAPANRRIVAPTSPILIPKVQPARVRRYLPLLWLAIIGIIGGVALSFVLDELLYLALTAAGVVLACIVFFLRRRASSRARAENDQQVAQAKGQLAGALMDRRILTAQEARSVATGPADVLPSFAGTGDGPSTPLVAVASGARQWQPPVGSMQAAGWDPQGIVEGHSTLAAVPFEVDMGKPFAIAGPRPAALAIARYLTLEAAERVGAQNVAIDSDQPADWAWSEGLVNPDPSSASFIVCDRADTTTPSQGLFITDTPHPSPPGLGGLLSLNSTGLAKLHDATGNAVAEELVPYGITTKSAAAATAAAPTERERRRVAREAGESAARKAEAAKVRRSEEAAARRAAESERRAKAEAARREAAAQRQTAASQRQAGANQGQDPQQLVPTPATTPPDPPAVVPSSPPLPPKPAPPTAVVAPPDRLTPPEPPPAPPVRPPASDHADREATSTTLFSADELGEANVLLATVTLDLAKKLSPDRFSFAILDSGSRPMIRLRQMRHCVGYAGLDHDADVDAVLELVRRHRSEPTSSQLLVLAVSDLVATLAYLENSGRAAQALNLREALASADGIHLLVIGSTRHDVSIPSHLAELVSSEVGRRSDGSAHVSDASGSRQLSFDETPAQDLTGAIAQLTGSGSR